MNPRLEPPPMPRPVYGELYARIGNSPLVELERIPAPG